MFTTFLYDASRAACASHFGGMHQETRISVPHFYPVVTRIAIKSALL